jgi:hypothetical protein
MDMNNTVFGLTSVHISLISVAISFFSFGMASYLAWRTKFSPPKLVGTFPYAILWTFSEKADEKHNEFFLIPFFWLSNTGAKPMLVAGMRLVVSPSEEKSFTLLPIHSVPAEAIESPNTFSDFKLLKFGDAPFGGFYISSSEKWTNNLVFSLSHEQRAYLKGSVQFSVEVKRVGACRFKKVLHQEITFDHPSFDWFTWAGVGGPSAAYYYSNALANST